MIKNQPKYENNRKPITGREVKKFRNITLKKLIVVEIDTVD